MSNNFLTFALLLSLGVIFIRLKLIEKRLSVLERASLPVPVRLGFYEIVDGQEVRITMADIQIGKPKKLVARAEDAAGNPAVLEAGSLKVSATDPSMLNIVTEDDGSITVSAVGPLGDAGGALMLQASGDADLGEGELQVFGELPINVVAGDAVRIVLSLE